MAEHKKNEHHKKGTEHHGKEAHHGSNPHHGKTHTMDKCSCPHHKSDGKKECGCGCC